MPSILKVRIAAARNLPIMDVRTELTDAYVELRLADFDVKRTETARRTLNPVWNEDFRFEVGDDSVIQNEPLELRVVDSDVITSDDIIGLVFFDLNPLLTAAWDEGTAGAARGSPGQISGWVPIVDTLLGVRGEINVQIRLQFFGDSNPFRDSSAGVQYFCTPSMVACPPPGPPVQRRGTMDDDGRDVIRVPSDIGPESPTHGDIMVYPGQAFAGPGGYYYRVSQVLGFVELLDWNDDPEYHWADTFRTPRFSNESRQLLLFRLSGHIRRQLGKRVAAMGGNAVVGFRQYLDLEKSERIITYRAKGTAVLLTAAQPTPVPYPVAEVKLQGTVASESGMDGANNEEIAPEAPRPRHARTSSASATVPPTASGTPKPAVEITTSTPVSGSADSTGALAKPEPKGRTSSRPSEKLLIPVPEPSPAELAPSTGDAHSTPGVPGSVLRPSTPVTALPNNAPQPYSVARQTTAATVALNPKLRAFSTDRRLVTVSKFPNGAVSSIGGLVTARSVKLIEADDDEDEVRDAWWTELRDEIESHARALGCSYVVGYTETTTISDELYVLTASGTAANLDLALLAAEEPQPARWRGRQMVGSGASSPVADDGESVASGMGGRRLSSPNGMSVAREGTNASSVGFDRRRRARRKRPCSICHISYNRHATPFPMTFTKCGRCGRRYVPEMILATMEPPAELETLDQTVLIEAHVCRQKKRAEGEQDAEIVSDALPFVQYDIHRQLIYKLRIYGMNAIFGLKFQLSVGDNLIVATAVGTGMYLKALPLPAALKIARNLGVIDEEDRKLLEIQERIVQLSEDNRRVIEAELSRSLAQAAARRAKAAEEEGEQNGTGGSVYEDTATYDGTAASGSDSADSDSGDEGRRRRRGSWGSANDARTVPVIQSSVIVQIDDDTDEDLMAVLLDRRFSDAFQLLSIESLPPRLAHLKVTRNANSQFIVVVRQGIIAIASHHPNRQLAALFREMYEELAFRLSYMQPCAVLGIEHDVQVLDDYEVYIRLTASVVGQAMHLPESRLASQLDLFLSSSSLLKSLPPIPKEESDSPGAENGKNPDSLPDSVGSDTREEFDRMVDLALAGVGDKGAHSFGSNGPTPRSGSDSGSPRGRGDSTGDAPQVLQFLTVEGQGERPSGTTTPVPMSLAAGGDTLGRTGTWAADNAVIQSAPPVRFVEITPLSHIPGCRVVRYLGVLSFHFVKESYLEYDATDQSKGMGGFVHGFFGEMLAVVRAHSAALGGNAVLAFRVDHAVFSENVKGTGYAVITCSGDVVQVAPDSVAVPGDPATGGLDFGFLGPGDARADMHPLTWTMDLQMKFGE
ncbi:hypothetical protein DFJ74DRAFT_768609 [Hyaloraphidium curvatum]|nr:hypothetical protein DFJ74DRAFT_768609 [Hyaloraphidium curvatum]